MRAHTQRLRADVPQRDPRILLQRLVRDDSESDEAFGFAEPVIVVQAVFDRPQPLDHAFNDLVCGRRVAVRRLARLRGS